MGSNELIEPTISRALVCIKDCKAVAVRSACRRDQCPETPFPATERLSTIWTIANICPGRRWPVLRQSAVEPNSVHRMLGINLTLNFLYGFRFSFSCQNYAPTSVLSNLTTHIHTFYLCMGVF